MGVAYDANYLIWCDMARTDFIRQYVRSYAEIERDGVALAVSEANVRYHAAVRYEDRVRIETTLVEVRSRALVFEYLLTRQPSGERVASARTTLVSLSRDGKPAAMPADLRDRLKAAAA